MHLLAEEEAILAGESGETRQQMMEILVALGKVFSADRLVPIRSAQVSGASYKTIGEAGLEWLSTLDARVSVPTILNPVGMDRVRWREMEIGQAFARKQEDVINAYARLGIKLECTCTPYYIYQTRFGDHLAWSESSAVAYANSVIGARTNREGGPSALAAAIIGKTPEYGLHRVEERKPQIVIRIDRATNWEESALYGALGYFAGSEVGDKIPYVQGIRPKRDHLKALGAALAASGAVALFHVEGITPEARIFEYDVGSLEVLSVEPEEILSLMNRIPVDAVALGCPHCSPEELTEIAGLLEGRRVTRPLYIFASRKVIEKSTEAVACIERYGGRVFADTCMVVSPALEQYGAIMVNSGKALAYVPNMCGAAVRIGTTEECINSATEGS